MREMGKEIAGVGIVRAKNWSSAAMLVSLSSVDILGVLVLSLSFLRCGGLKIRFSDRGCGGMSKISQDSTSVGSYCMILLFS